MTVLPLSHEAAIEKIIRSRWRVRFIDGCTEYASDHGNESAVAAVMAAFDQLAAAHPELSPRINGMRVVCDPVHRDDEISGVPA